jgi:hypothetical protein
MGRQQLIIQFNREGKMINGQHRCAAVVETGIPIIGLMVRNVANDWCVSTSGSAVIGHRGRIGPV